MTPHTFNVGLHIGAGSVAMAIGFLILALAKGTARHRQLGRRFAWFTLVVCLSAAVGNIVFRFMPLFAVLTVLVSYQLLSGWHAVYTREQGPDRLDAGLGVVATVCAAALIPLVSTSHGRESAPVVICSTLAALFALLAYDWLRWVFPRRWHASLWRREHIYKILSAMFAMLSAAAGNLFPQGQPWSQLLPSLAGLTLIAVFLWREQRRFPFKG